MTSYTLMPGKPFEGTEEETMQTIRDILTADFEAKPKARKAKAQKRSAAAETADGDSKQSVSQAFVARTLGRAPRRRATDFPELAKVSSTPARPRTRPFAKLVGKVSGLLPTSFSSVRGFRPTTHHLAIVSALLLLVVRPHWVVIATVVLLATVIAAFLLLGADRIWGRVITRLARIEARDPIRATMLRTRLDAFAYRWDSLLDLFPDGMVDALYMPDFQSLAVSDEQNNSAVADRLDRMAREG